METVQISLDRDNKENATIYAKHKGVELSALIEDFLLRIVPSPKEEESEIPDVVLSLLGAGTPVDTDDLNGRKALYSHLEKKYQ